MPQLSGYGDKVVTIGYRNFLAEYVRTDTGQVWRRLKGQKWTFMGDQSVSEKAWSGMQWCTHKTGLMIASKRTRLPAKGQ